MGKSISINHLPNRDGYLREPRMNRIIVLEDLNFIWDRSELREIKKMWEKNFSIQYMSDYFERDPDEIMLALIHLARDERIKARRDGLKGKSELDAVLQF